MESTNECDINANCTNTEGTYNCTCKSGFVGDGKDCTGVECLLKFCLLRKITELHITYMTFNALPIT